MPMLLLDVALLLLANIDEDCERDEADEEANVEKLAHECATRESGRGP